MCKFDNLKVFLAKLSCFSHFDSASEWSAYHPTKMHLLYSYPVAYPHGRQSVVASSCFPLACNVKLVHNSCNVLKIMLFLPYLSRKMATAIFSYRIDDVTALPGQRRGHTNQRQATVNCVYFAPSLRISVLIFHMANQEQWREVHTGGVVKKGPYTQFLIVWSDFSLYYPQVMNIYWLA
jgi:hypothetical protein